ncbi:hypothetical protein SAMN04488008_10310 [Maribacter orientalis]|uniref:Uncharacterized protein n=1 Tax=Maribacter orientalis TaxID=228957 RepID=A0A1H7MW85_9FLAO|nr:hypothetical protein [Maribacter orientalis]SEL14867.1 hypothetical protein SAMN04488008_10310 [Maribacter orientalis]|tara:strand:- start:949 stop:1494 length:546 start_codon:yes stop_codon:yes gene_type:complete
MKGFRILVTVIFGFLLVIACSEPQDFDQLDNLEITPTYETSVFYVKAQESLINRVSGLSFFTQDFNFDAFEEPFFAERVLSGVLSYELENTTSKPIEISLEFLDENENILDTEEFRMDAAPTSTLIRNVAYGPTGKSLDIIKNTSKIRLVATNLGDGSSTSNLTNPSIVLRSSAKFTLELK